MTGFCCPLGFAEELERANRELPSRLPLWFGVTADGMAKDYHDKQEKAAAAIAAFGVCVG